MVLHSSFLRHSLLQIKVEQSAVDVTGSLFPSDPYDNTPGETPRSWGPIPTHGTHPRLCIGPVEDVSPTRACRTVGTEAVVRSFPALASHEDLSMNTRGVVSEGGSRRTLGVRFDALGERDKCS